MVIRPVLFRPAFLLKPSVRDLTGRPFQSSERSIRTSPRWPGVVGLYDFNAILLSSVCFFRSGRPGIRPAYPVLAGRASARRTGQRPVVMSMALPSSSVTYAFLVVFRVPRRPRKRLVLPFVVV